MDTTRRSFVQTLGATGATAALAGCDAASDALLALLDPPAGSDFAPPTGAEIDLETHVLNRLTWGPAPGEYGRVRGLGLDAYVEEQLHPEAIVDRASAWRVASIESVAEPTAELYDHDPRQLLLDATRYKLLRGAFSRRQLYEVMVDFWTDHFNIVSEKGDCRWLKLADDRDVVRAHALGRFRDLVRASALSPAMLIYLDGHDNKVEKPGDKPNENYARELLELHTLGVHGGYTQDDVMEVARCLSGWTYRNRPLRFGGAARVEFQPARHDDGAKRLLGHDIAAGGGAEDLDRVLDIVCAHPATAEHLAGKLCRRFIAETPPAEAVRDVADAFRTSGGDVKDTLRALFAGEAFRSARGGLFKRPLRFVLSALRATGARTNCSPALVDYLERMGHAPFQYPTPDGYPLEPAPWLGTLLWRWKFALAVTSGGVKGTRVDRARLVGDCGGLAAAAAHLLGRAPTALETSLLEDAPDPLALLLASPAFQRH